MKYDLSFKSFVIEYLVLGKGKEILFAFHGFNNEARDFAPLEKDLGSRFTIVSVNLFFHGKSFAPKDIIESGLAKKEFVEIMEKLMTLFPCEKYSLMGYSMGGRLALEVVEFFAAKIEMLALLAPDGLTPNYFYRFATRTSIGRNLFGKVISDPGRLFYLSSGLSKLGLLNEKKHRFAKMNLETREKRKKVHDAWMIYRFLIPDTSKIKSLINKYQIRVALFFGEHDVLMPPSMGKKFMKNIESQSFLHVLETGHQLLKEKNLREISSRLKEGSKFNVQR